MQIFRPAAFDDVAAIEVLLRDAGLPTVQVPEKIGGFVVTETDDRLVACGGVELYSAAAVLRSVAVAPEVRGAGIGREMVQRLETMALAASTLHLCLFTVAARLFWQRQGYEDGSLADWPEPAHACWQYQYVSTHEDEFRKMGLQPMFKRLQ